MPLTLWYMGFLIRMKLLIRFIPLTLCYMENKRFSIGNPLFFAYTNPLFPGYIERNDLGNARAVPTLFGLEVGLSHQRQLYIVGRIMGCFPQ